MRRHTPGPWQRGDGDSIETEDGRQIADAWVADVGLDQAEANARLIAAAPALYAALAQIKGMETLFDLPREYRDLVTSALAKADGE